MKEALCLLGLLVAVVATQGSPVNVDFPESWQIINQGFAQDFAPSMHMGPASRPSAPSFPPGLSADKLQSRPWSGMSDEQADKGGLFMRQQHAQRRNRLKEILGEQRMVQLQNLHVDPLTQSEPAQGLTAPHVPAEDYNVSPVAAHMNPVDDDSEAALPRQLTNPSLIKEAPQQQQPVAPAAAPVPVPVPQAPVLAAQPKTQPQAVKQTPQQFIAANPYLQQMFQPQQQAPAFGSQFMQQPQMFQQPQPQMFAQQPQMFGQQAQMFGQQPFAQPPQMFQQPAMPAMNMFAPQPQQQLPSSFPQLSMFGQGAAPSMFASNMYSPFSQLIAPQAPKAPQPNLISPELIPDAPPSAITTPEQPQSVQQATEQMLFQSDSAAAGAFPPMTQDMAQQMPAFPPMTQDMTQQMPAFPRQLEEEQLLGLPQQPAQMMYGGSLMAPPPAGAYPAPPMPRSGFPLMHPFGSVPEPRTENFGALPGYPPRVPASSMGAMQFEERGNGVF